MFLWICRILCFIPLNIMHPTFIKGRKNMPEGKALVCCNHISNWDMVLYYLNTSRRMKIMAKKQMFKNKLVGAVIKNWGAFPVDREGNDITAIKNSIKFLKEGKKLFIFPEGTRLKDKTKVLGDLKSGLAMIAIKTKTPIVPIWIAKRPRLFRKSVYITGKPFELDEFYDQKLDEETLLKATEVVREKMLELREQSLANKKSKKQGKEV